LAGLPGIVIDRAELIRLDVYDLPLNDTLIEVGKRRGFLSVGQVNDVLPSHYSDDQIRELLDSLERNGTQVLSEGVANRYRHSADVAKHTSS